MGDFYKEVVCRSQYDSSNMFLQVQEETWFYYQEIKGKILCERRCTEETVSWTLELTLSSGPVGHSEVDFKISVFNRFAESK